MTANSTSPTLLLIRHAPTDWNDRKIYQGRSDIPLNEKSEKEFQKRSLLPEFRDWSLYSSPLKRALQTAELLGRRGPTLVPEAIEMNFGELEGQPITAPTETLNAENQFGWKGLDHRAPGGESLREVQARIRPWLSAFAAGGQNGVLVTHKGVIQALVADAYGWEMASKRPYKIDFTKAHRLQVSAAGKLKILRLNEEHSSI